MQTVLITGEIGLIGSALCCNWQGAGYRILILTRRKDSTARRSRDHLCIPGPRRKPEMDHGVLSGWMPWPTWQAPP